MLLLFETPAGYSLFKVKDESKIKDIDVSIYVISFRFFVFTLFLSLSSKSNALIGGAAWI
jgi:hypothetical protein